MFDRYLNSSLKDHTRSERGAGIRRKVTSTTYTLKRWELFLKDADNKTEFFQFMAEKIVSLPSENDIIVTRNDQALSNKNRDLSGLTCSHEEADTRIFVHARYAIIAGAKRITMKVNDTDILVITISLFSFLQQDGLQELWLNFGKSSSRKLIPVHSLVTSLGPECCSGLLFFHALSGCDTFQHSETKETSQCTTPGMQSLKFLQFSRN